MKAEQNRKSEGKKTEKAFPLRLHPSSFILHPFCSVEQPVHHEGRFLAHVEHLAEFLAGLGQLGGGLLALVAHGLELGL